MITANLVTVTVRGDLRRKKSGRLKRKREMERQRRRRRRRRKKSQSVKVTERNRRKMLCRIISTIGRRKGDTSEGRSRDASGNDRMYH